MSEPHSLRRGAPADADAIGRLTREAYAPWVRLIGREPLPLQVDYAEAVRLHRFDVLEDAGGMIALIETRVQEDLLLIVNVAVSPERQGQGLGRRMLAHAEALAAEAGLAGMRLYTNQRFEKNVRLYAALGYAVERLETRPVGVVVHMTKRFG